MYTSGSCGGVRISVFELCVYVVYERIVKNGARSDCGTSHVSKKYQHP